MTQNTQKKKKVRKKLTKILTHHYIKLVWRSSLFVAVLVFYILDKVNVLSGFWGLYPLLAFVWLFFIGEMLMRFFPSKHESMGCQKQFSRNYEPTDIPDATPRNQSGWTTALVAFVWLALNAVIGVLYFTRVIDAGILILISIAYSICDIVCILFFCPFQTWFMKNRCCTTCRIYNWDFAMMFTPLIFLPHWYTYTLLGASLAILIRWEITYKVHPERFSVCTNKCLDCSKCEEKLCSHKTQLRSFIRKHKDKFVNWRADKK